MAQPARTVDFAEVPLQEGEVICPKCKGYSMMKFWCNKCFGYGKLDWVEVITGKDPDLLRSSFSSTSTSSSSTSRRGRSKAFNAKNH